MARVEKDDAREERIDMEVVVDAYGEEEPHGLLHLSWRHACVFAFEQGVF